MVDVCVVGPSSSASTSRTSPPAPAPSQSLPQQRPHSFPEATIQRLTSLGFARAQVIDELTRCNGDADQALASLFAKSFQLP